VALLEGVITPAFLAGVMLMVAWRWFWDSECENSGAPAGPQMR